MGRVVVLENVFEPKARRCCRHDGPLINWLEREYPDGFRLPHVAAFNLDPLRVADYDREIGPYDTITIAFLPAGPIAAGFAAIGGWAAVGQALLGAVISFGLGYLAQSLTSTADPATSPASVVSNQAAESVYNLSVPTNQVRTGRPVPVNYGRNWVYPDIASQPYKYFDDNELYVCQILCLGQGEHLINDEKIGDTSVDDLASGVAEVTYYGPDDHGQTFGVIEDDSGVKENVYTSSEVTDLEISADNTIETTGTIWNGTWENYTGGIFYLDEQNLQLKGNNGFGGGLWLHVSGTPSSDGDYEVAFINYYTDENYREDQYARKGHIAIGDSFTGLTESLYGVALTFSNTETLGGSVAIGPYTANPKGTVTDTLEYDVEFPRGLYDSDAETGVYETFSVDLRFVAQPIDDDGNDDGDPEEYTVTISDATATPQRFTYTHSVPSARYEVTVYRDTDESLYAGSSSICYWTGLKAILGNTGDDEIYGETTMMAVKIKASQGLSSSSHNRVHVDCTRKIDGVATRNPIDAFRDIYTNTVYGGRRPDSELDDDTLDALETAWASDYFDARFDTDSTVWEALKLALQLKFAAPVISGALVSAVVDEEPSVAEVTFTEDQIVDLTLGYDFGSPSDHDGVEGEYVSEDDGAKLYELYPADSGDPEKVALFGCRDETVATDYVEAYWLRKQYRRLLATIDLEGDGHTLSVGTVLALDHPLTSVDDLWVVMSIKTNSEFSTTVGCYRDESEVWA